MGIVSFTFETAYTWDRFEEVDTEIMRRIRKAQKENLGGGIVCRRFSFLYPDGPAPYYSIMAPSTHANSLEAYTMLHDVASDALIELGATIAPPCCRKIVPSLVRQSRSVVPPCAGSRQDRTGPEVDVEPGLIVDKPAGLKIVG